MDSIPDCTAPLIIVMSPSCNTDCPLLSSSISHCSCLFFAWAWGVVQHVGYHTPPPPPLPTQSHHPLPASHTFRDLESVRLLGSSLLLLFFLNWKGRSWKEPNVSTTIYSIFFEDGQVFHDKTKFNIGLIMKAGKSMGSVKWVFNE